VGSGKPRRATGPKRDDGRRPTSGLRPRDDTPPEAWEPELWIDEGPVRAAAKKAVARGNEADKRLPRRRLPAEVVDELDTLGGPNHAARHEERLEAARRAFDRDRWPEAARILGKLAREAPGSPSVRELHGLTLYRLERWRAAAGELEAYRTLTGAVDQNPVLADCYRALKRYRSVEPLWEELKEVSPSAELVTEGRIVVAGALADQGRVAEAIELLARTAPTPRRIRPHHLRQWYALADLYDRSGDVPRARALFSRIEAAAPGFADTTERLRTVGR
jgi:tetratricopeptide (TPR) repeat protein